MVLVSTCSGRFGELILVYGTICIDRTRTIERLPPVGGYSEVLNERIALGGEAANTAFSLMRWGAEYKLAGNPIGLEGEGKLLADLVVASGLSTNDLQAAESITPVCDIYVTPNGERTMFGVGFATISDYLQPISAPYQAGGWFTLDSNLRTSGEEAMSLAVDKGMHLYVMDILNPSAPLGDGSFWQCSTDWAGVRGDTQQNVEWLKGWIDEQGCFAVLSDGPNGLVAGSPHSPVRHYPPYPCPKMLDSTGAGDMFRAGMLFGLDQGWPVRECLSFAAAAACLKCQGLGAISHVPTVEEIRSHIRANPQVASVY